MSVAERQVDVAVVGGGPSGLAAAAGLRRRGIARVLVLEREAEAGGVPRHTAHTGFGLRDLRRLLDGPAYAARRVRLATDAGAVVETETTVTGWAGPTSLETTSPRGLARITADAILLATGCRERPRSARLVPGDRPHGVLTTGTLQQLVHLHRRRVGRRAVVVGAEHVSFSALLALAHAGATTVAMVTEHARHQTYAPLAWATARRLRVPILSRSRVSAIIGRERVEAVEVASADGATHRLACDTVVLTGDWIPDHELARGAGLVMDPGTHAPRVDQSFRTSTPGVFAAGNLVHAVETADVCALAGHHAAAAIHDFLIDRAWPTHVASIACEPPIAWVSPNALASMPRVLPRGRLLFRVTGILPPSGIALVQNDRILWRDHYRRLLPNTSLSATITWPDAVDLEGPPLTLRRL